MEKVQKSPFDSKEDYLKFMSEFLGVSEENSKLRMEDIKFFEERGFNFRESINRCLDMNYGFTKTEYFLNLPEEKQNSDKLILR
ncbi:MAG: hypothetical protein KG003_08060 [Bacteroidetes bacterium]|nr:hypothetical protein [Bacteroidota bacterium]